jgi:cobalt-zinc-cadmium efflux system membrane fusion protein
MEIDHSKAQPLGRIFVWGGIALGLLLVVVLFTHGFGLFAGNVAPPEAPLLVKQGDKILLPEGSPLRQRLTVVTVKAEPVNSRLSFPAIVESDPARTVNVLPSLGGRVVALKVALGDRVARGQVLAEIDSPDLAQAYDDNDKAKDAFELVEKNLARQKEQFKIGTASARDLDQAQSDHAQALAEYTRTQARLKAIDASAGGRGPRPLSVKAPVSGSITSLAVQPGNMINDPTQPIMTIADLETIWVTALVPEKDISVVSKNDEAEVRLVAYPDQVRRGKILFVSDTVEPDSRRDKIRIAFANSDYALKPNMFATVVLVGPEKPQITVPTSALLMNNDRITVFVASAPWTFERRTVEPRLEEGAQAVIESGLKAGEQVVITGGILLND